jgi:hypothetical protein
MFFTRPNIAPLGLEFVEVRDYGTSCPSQFDARTEDGRDFYIRYRGGYLSIDGAAERLLDLRVGPPLHGDILFEQVCDLAGLTIKGRSPEQLQDVYRHKIDHYSILDFSGRVTYWHRPLLLSQQAAQTLVDRFGRAMPDICLINYKWPEQHWVQVDSPGKGDWCAQLCFGINEMALGNLLSRRANSARELHDVFSHVVHFYFGFRWDEPQTAGERRPGTPIANAIGPEIKFAYGPWGELRASKGHLKTHFVTQDSNGQSFMQKIIAIVDSVFSNAVEAIDFATGESRGCQQIETWYSLDLAEWCRADQNRFLSWFSTDEKPPHYYGWRPAIGR